METNQDELEKLSKKKLIEMINGFQEKLTNMEFYARSLRVDSKGF